MLFRSPGRIEHGVIRFHGRDLLALRGDEMRKLRGAEIALIPQDPLSALVLGADRRARHVFVGGERVVEDAELVGADPVTLHSDLAARARLLWT